MAEESFQERTEQATPKRKSEARKKGNVPMSIEVNTAIVLLVGTLVFAIFSRYFMNGLRYSCIAVFGHLADLELTESNLPKYALMAGKNAAALLTPVLGSVLIAGVVANAIQHGFLLSPEAIKPKLEKINPIEGAKRIFSGRSMVELVKGVLKIGLVGYVGYVTIIGQFRDYFPLVDQDITQIIAFIGTMIFKIMIRAVIVLILLAAFDFAYQKYEFERKIRMTKQEVKEEFKQTEGDPLVKSRIRAIQRQNARRRMYADVSKADVVITNPVHVAVALRYDADEMSAPIVVAKGLRKIAERIKEIARQQGIPIVENPIIARMLYKTAEVGSAISIDMYQAVAEILAQLYNQR